MIEEPSHSRRKRSSRPISGVGEETGGSGQRTRQLVRGRAGRFLAASPTHRPGHSQLRGLPHLSGRAHGGSGTTAQPARMKRAATAAINGSAEFSVTPAMRKGTFPCPISDPAANMQ